ncbi:MAG: diguanylate cyclase [Alphaproteobacteria bacterium PA4]|nr:MAG: diguanylate cyclase [Alphaproteobacteria bacterium PA4]
MPFRLKLDDEAGRQAALDRYQIVDTAAEEEFEQIVQLVQRVFGTPMAAVTLIDRDRQWFKARRGLGPSETPRNIAFCHHTITAAEGLAVADARLDPRFAGTPLVAGEPHIRSYLGAPLRTPDGYQVGALCVISDEVRQFSAEEREILGRFSDVVVSQMELRQLASQDSLTGMLTRRAFDQLLYNRLADRHGPTGSAEPALAIIDLDHFKAINDCHGHGCGDAVLVAVAHAICTVLGPHDRLGRLGGEEFGVLLHENAAGVAEAIRAAIAATIVPELPGVAITASIGVAGLRAPVDSVDSWVHIADAALYAAKAQGRNRVVVA